MFDEKQIARFYKIKNAYLKVIKALEARYARRFIFSVQSSPGLDDFEMFLVRQSNAPNCDSFKLELGILKHDQLIMDDYRISTAKLIIVVDELIEDGRLG